MPRSEHHSTPIPDEPPAHTDPNGPDSRASRRARNWGGPRPGSGAPKGNLNALKHGRHSRQQAKLLEALLAIPETQDVLIALNKRNRRRRKQAEEGAGVLLTNIIERTAQLTLNSPLSPGSGQKGEDTGEGSGVREINQGQNNREFLAFLHDATEQLRFLLQKQPRRRGASIKHP